MARIENIIKNSLALMGAGTLCYAIAVAASTWTVQFNNINAF